MSLKQCKKENNFQIVSGIKLQPSFPSSVFTFSQSVFLQFLCGLKLLLYLPFQTFVHSFSILFYFILLKSCVFNLILLPIDNL